MKEYYLLLDITETCTLEDITTSFRKLAKQYHPDINHSPDANEKLRKVIEAYDWMKKHHVQRKAIKPKPERKPHDNMFNWTYHDSYKVQLDKKLTDIFRWITPHPSLSYSIKISQNIINENDIKVHCMYDLEEFAFIVPKGTKLPCKANLNTEFGAMTMMIYNDPTVFWDK